MTSDPRIVALFGEPPAGTNLNDSQVHINDGAVIAMLVLAAVAVFLRFVARFSLRNPLMADDWLVIVALLALAASAAMSIAGGKVGSGTHVWTTKVENIELIYKYLFSYTMIYAGGCTCTRLSILCFYKRIFSPMEPHLKWASVFGWFLTLTYPIYMWVATVTSCQPTSYFWSKYVGAEGKCVDLTKFFLATAVLNMLCDFIILLIPFPRIARLQMNLRKKLAVCGILAVGMFACIASVVRIYYISVFMNGPDATWLMGPVFIWSTIEPAVALACACMPHLTPLAKIAGRTVMSSLPSQKSKSSSANSSQPLNFGSGNSGSGNGARRSMVFHGQGHKSTFDYGSKDEDEIGLTNCVEVGEKDEKDLYGTSPDDTFNAVHVHSSFEQSTMLKH